MPIYTYRCQNCERDFEITQKISDDPIKVCPECQNPVKRVFQPVGIIFKGSGFYSTDNRKSSAKPAASVKPEKQDKKEAPADKKNDTGSKQETLTSA